MFIFLFPLNQCTVHHALLGFPAPVSESQAVSRSDHITVYLGYSKGHGSGVLLTLDMLLYAHCSSLPLESWAVQRDIHQKWSRMANVFHQCLAGTQYLYNRLLINPISLCPEAGLLNFSFWYPRLPGCFPLTRIKVSEQRESDLLASVLGKGHFLL